MKELIQDLNIHIKALGFLREWKRIAFVLILVCSVNKCNLFSTFCISGVVCCQGVLCALEGIKINNLCV